MSKARVILTTPIGTVPDFYRDSDGQFSLDISERTSIALTKEIDEETDVSIIKQDSIKTIDLPFTKKNIALLGAYGNPTSFNFNHFKPFEVKIQWGALNMENLQARILKIDARGWVLNIRAEDFNWVGPLTDLKLQDVDLGSITFDEAWLQDNHTNRWTFSDGDDGVFMPLVNYGKWRLKDEGLGVGGTNLVALEDYRFWFSPLHVLRQAFCTIGWKFVCPFLEGTHGRRLWTYILGENWNETAIDPLLRGFRAELTGSVNAPSTATTIVVFDDDSTTPNFDTGNNYDNTTGKYSSAIIGRFSATIDIQYVDTLGGGNGVTNDLVELEIRLQPLIGSSILLKKVEVNLASSLAGQTVSYALDTSELYVYGGDNVYVQVVNVLDSRYQVSVVTGTFTVFVRAAIIQRGDTVDLAATIHPDYTAMQYLKGIAHLCNFKYETNPTLRTVSFYPAQDAEIYYNEDVEGFFKPITKARFDISKKVLVDSAKMELKERNQKRNYTLAFAENEDYNINQLNLDKPYLSNAVDFGEQFDNGETINRNPFFAPTININDTSIVRAKTIGRAPYIPALWDGEPIEGEYPNSTNKIKPRICLAFPYDFITKFSDFSEMFGQIGGGRVEFECANGTTQQAMSLFGQVFPKYIVPEQAPYLAAQQVDEAIAYSPVQMRDDLIGTYGYFYKKALKDFYYGFTINFLVQLDINDISNFTFRDILQIEYNFKRFGTKTFYARAVQISDYVIGRNISTPVIVLPEIAVFDVEC